jgi:hypothetical protein
MEMIKMSISKPQIDYLTVSLAEYKLDTDATTTDILSLFASILTDTYKNTCRDMVGTLGKSERVSQYGITVSKQYGTATKKDWVYSVSLSGEYWQAIYYTQGRVLDFLQLFQAWQISRLDLFCNVQVPLSRWRKYTKSAFNSGHSVTGKGDAMTVYYNSRLSQFFVRVYNKSAESPKYHPAPDGQVIVRYEVEIKRVRGEVILKNIFKDTEVANKIFIQRVRKDAENDTTGFIRRYFDSNDEFEKVKTVGRIVGNLEDTVEYVFKAYRPYIMAGLQSEATKKQLEIDRVCPKVQRVLAVLTALEDDTLPELQGLSEKKGGK